MRFELEAIGAISHAEGGAAHAGHLAEVREIIVRIQTQRALVEPQSQTGRMDAVVSDDQVKVEAVDEIE